MTLEDHIRLDGLRSILRYGREKIIVIGVVKSCQFPLPQFLDDQRVERNRLTGRFRLGVAFDVVPNGMCDVGLHEFKVDIAPTKSDELTAAQTSASSQHHHDTLALGEFQQERLKLFRGQDVRDSKPFG
jgi:hypothetical protein